ncbi:unnamed protein product, partial [Symbiodinium microadriaticum]
VRAGNQFPSDKLRVLSQQPSKRCVYFTAGLLQPVTSILDPAKGQSISLPRRESVNVLLGLLALRPSLNLAPYLRLHLGAGCTLQPGLQRPAGKTSSRFSDLSAVHKRLAGGSKASKSIRAQFAMVHSHVLIAQEQITIARGVACCWSSARIDCTATCMDGVHAVVQKNAGNAIITATLLLLLPWTAFSLMLCLFVFAFKDFGPLIWGLIACSELLALLVLGLGSARRQQAQVLLGCLVIASILAAIPAGEYIESTFMDEYWRLGYGAVYEGVSPLSPGASYLDASFMAFDKTAYIDVSKGLGFIKGGASVLRRAGRASRAFNVSFWVTGIDCCARRGSFACLGSQDAAGGSGVVLSDSDGIFTRAARMAQSVNGFGILPDAQILLLVWTHVATS